MFESLKRSWSQAVEKARDTGATGTAAVYPSVREMPVLASEFVDVCRTRNIGLDYSLLSLDVLDRFLAQTAKTIGELSSRNDPQVPGLIGKNVSWTGAYLGEVLRRISRCRWEAVSDVPMLAAGGGYHKPLQIVVGLLRDGSFKVGQTSFTSTRAYAEAVQQMEVERALGLVLGGAPTLDALKAAVSADGQLAAWIVSQTHAAVLTGAVKFGADLDFSIASVEQVEQILANMHERSAKAAPGQGATPEQIDGAVKAWGPYVGEVLRRVHGGHWTLDRASGVITLDLPGAKVFPLEKVHKRLVNGEADNVAYFVKVTGLAVSGGLTGVAAPRK